MPAAASARFLERLPLGRDRPWLTLAITLGLCALGLLVRVAADPLLPPGFPYLTFFPVVIVSSFLFGIRRGIVAALICGVIAWYAFIPPARSFALATGSVTALLFYAFVCATDIALVHWMQRANAGVARERERNARLAETRELLFRELQHRVSNNLQVAAGLLSLQKRKVAGDDARAALDEAARRLALIGRISRQLYAAGGETRTLSEFLQPLGQDVIEASGRTDVTCSIETDADAALSPEAAVPVALIVAEAISNAIEHGFHARDGGRIAMRLSRPAPETMLIEVADDGRGLPAGFALEANDSLGLRIATMLAGQLGGRFELVGGQGTTARLTLPA